MSDSLASVRQITRDDSAGEAIQKARSAEAAYAAELRAHYQGLQTLIRWLITHPQNDADVQAILAAGFLVHDRAGARIPADLSAAGAEADALVGVLDIDDGLNEAQLGLGLVDDTLAYAHAVLSEVKSLENLTVAVRAVCAFGQTLESMSWSDQFTADHPDTTWTLPPMAPADDPARSATSPTPPQNGTS